MEKIRTKEEIFEDCLSVSPLNGYSFKNIMATEGSFNDLVNVGLKAMQEFADQFREALAKIKALQDSWDGQHPITPIQMCTKAYTIATEALSETGDSSEQTEDSKRVAQEYHRQVEEKDKEIVELNEECKRLAGIAEHWQTEYYKLNPPRQPGKIDNL